jgi:hypothetical protein
MTTIFKNLQLFSGLTSREIITALQLVMAGEKNLVALVPNSSDVRLIPYELGAPWKVRAEGDLELIEINIDDFDPGDPCEGWLFRIMSKCLYEPDGLNRLLGCYHCETDMFWVCENRKMAANLMVAMSNKTPPEVIPIDFLADDDGKIYEALQQTLYPNKDKTRSAYDISAFRIRISNMGVADPPPKSQDVTINYPVKTREFAAVIEVWEKYWADGKGGIPKEALIQELTDKGFTIPSAKAIDRVSRPEYAREGRRSKKK